RTRYSPRAEPFAAQHRLEHGQCRPRRLDRALPLPPTSARRVCRHSRGSRPQAACQELARHLGHAGPEVPGEPCHVPGPVPDGALLPLPLLALGLVGASALDSDQRIRELVVSDNILYAAVEAYDPKFVLYYGVPPVSAYQVCMMIDFLERIGERFIVVLRRTSAFREITRLTDAPVVVRTNIWQLDDVITPNMTAAFYVNNSAPN